MSNYDLLIRDSLAPARVRSALDKLLSAGNPLPALDENDLRRFVRVAENSRYAIDVLRSFDEAWEILSTGRGVPVATLPDILAVRRYLALSLFEVAIADCLEDRPFVETLGMLSRVASRCVEETLALVERPLRESYGLPEGAPSLANGAGSGGAGSCGFAVLGMGKLGGGELNFSSDIDLVFVYRGDGETSGGTRGCLTNVEWYTRLAEKLVDGLSSRRTSPFAYPVDLRLRPEGKSGPIVRSLASTIRYYEREGSTWERQAFLKASPIAGDRALGTDLLLRLQPFIFRRYLDRDAIFQIEAIKARIEAQAREHGRRHIKLSTGGIREIEFIVQLLQLASGGRCEAVRTPSTLAALDRLVENRYLIESDRDRLRTSYLFLRRLEHRVQMMDARQTHLLPEDPDEMTDLGRRMGYRDGDALWKEYLAITTEVRRFYETHFERSRDVSVTPVEEHVMRLLEDAGENAPGGDRTWMNDEDAVQEFRKMSRGSMADPLTSGVRRFFIRSSAVWLPMIEALPGPKSALKNLSRMVEAYGAKSTLYEIFCAHPAVAELIVNIAALSDPLADRICRDPSTLEALLSPGGVTGHRDRAELEARLAALLKYAPDASKARLLIEAEERLRIGVRFLMGLADARQTGRELSTVAELMLGDSLDLGTALGVEAVPHPLRMAESCGTALGVEAVPHPPRMAESCGIVALGRFGASDLGFTSDFDLVFVSSGDPVAVTQAVQKRTEQWARMGLKIDTRLRPMGRTSPLVVSIDRLRSYFAATAETWERIAWARARVIMAAPELRAEIEACVAGFVYEKAFGERELAELRAMRKRLRAESTAGDIKRGDGAMIDLDFCCAIRRITTRAESLDPEVLLASEPALLEGYRFLRTVDHVAQASLGRSFRGDETEGEMERIRFLLERQHRAWESLPSVRREIASVARAWMGGAE
jgi:[glutamine synthetase] adenylyltransferase / [glutamine synthetase]-adenylyl-L-tyrosine phosphorylase